LRRLVSTVGLSRIPAEWLKALNDGGRLVTNLAGTGMVIAADKTPDGGARGQVTSERAGFMATRTGADYPPSPSTRHAWTDEGQDIGTGRYPVVQVAETWELMSAYALSVPGVQHGYDEDADGVRTAVMSHEDGSWARATGRKGERPTVHQAGSRRLWALQGPDAGRPVGARGQGVPVLRRLRSGSHKDARYTAFREVGGVIRAIQLLRYLTDPQMRRRVTAATNKVGVYYGCSEWVRFGSRGVITDNDLVEQEKAVKFNALLSNCLIFHITLDIAQAVRELQARAGRSSPRTWRRSRPT
jgi:hypothetical protein